MGRIPAAREGGRRMAGRTGDRSWQEWSQAAPGSSHAAIPAAAATPVAKQP